MIAASKKPNSTYGSETQFPGKLHKMMQYVEQNSLESIISWELNGHGFRINDPDRLVEILPIFFGQTKYRSFRRQVNMWHFHRILEGPHAGVFIHPYFIKYDPSLCSQMSRHIPFKPTCQQQQGFIESALCLEPNPIVETKMVVDEESSRMQSTNKTIGFMSMMAIEKEMQQLHQKFPCDVSSSSQMITTNKTSLESSFQSSTCDRNNLKSPISMSGLPTLPGEAVRSFSETLQAIENLISSDYEYRQQNENTRNQQQHLQNDELAMMITTDIEPLDSLDVFSDAELSDGDAVSFEGKSFFFIDPSKP